VPGDARAGGLVAAVAGALAVTAAGGAAGDGTGPGVDDPQPASATSTTNAAAVTSKRLSIPSGRRTPPPGCTGVNDKMQAAIR
jgi:hypothetical protein